MTEPERHASRADPDRARLAEWAALVGDDLPERVDPGVGRRE